ncbi:autophagy protein apg9 domain-containing protein [Ditylenchus destructor]|uniref:Autophagy-related protein 9 n=1 Tax=Ditylenchus destructor TaxID=166010 RepID=A0AAD4RAJ4_9BILA|nr:autophagy protein apg9 domain-containing protein [Ditylenchus destructor]
MFLGNRRANYKVIDGEEEEGGEAGHNSDDENTHGAPPASHEIINVSFEGVEREVELVSSSKRDHRWDHIENIDQFFTLVYEYHQGNGFACIALRHAFALFQFIFVICFSTFLLQCVDYDVLFNNSNTTTSGELFARKRHINDAIIPYCASSFHPLIVIALLLAGVFWLAHLLRVGYKLLQLCEMRTFFSTVLKISDNELSNVTWQDVVLKLCKLQPELHLIINQDKITSLDVYQRILRYKNYFVALVYRDLLPPQINVPFVGRTHYLSSGLRLNLEWLFFWGPWSPWKDAYTLRDEFRNPEASDILGRKVRQTIAWMSLINLIMCPFVFLYQVLFSFFSYADLVKRDPGIFGTRRYSNYGRENVRHFNELDHELNTRLNRSYGFAVRYMDQFTSPMAEIIAKTVTFTCGSIFAVLVVLSAWDEDVLNIEHLITVMTATGAIVVICRSFIPNENMVFCQGFLMRQIIASIHYAPKSWLKEAHSTEVFKEFSQLFQLKAQYLAEELLSPLITPYVLYFHIRPKAADFVHFFANNTHFVEGLGDVCSYSMMDITRDGDRGLARLNQSMIENPINASNKSLIRGQSQNSCGKIEMSLLNFATLNPGWEPSPAATSFINNVKDLVAQEITANPENAQLPLQCSLQDLETSMRQAALTGGHDLTMSMAAFASNPNQSIQQHSGPTRSTANLFEESTSAHEEDDDGDEDGPPSSFLTANSKPASSLARQSSVPSGETKERFGSQHAVSVTANTVAGSSNSGMASSQRENNARAMEMSANALALNRLLMSSLSVAAAPPRQHGYEPFDSLRNRPGHLGYGAFATNAGSSMLPNPPIGASRYGTVTGSVVASNIWGVPEMSQIASVTDASGRYTEQQPIGGGRTSLYRPGTGNYRSHMGLEEEDVGHDHLDPMTP